MSRGEGGLLKGNPNKGSSFCRQQSIAEHARLWDLMGALWPEGAQEVQRVAADPKIFATMAHPNCPDGQREDEDGQLPLPEDQGFTVVSDPEEWGWRGGPTDPQMDQAMVVGAQSAPPWQGRGPGGLLVTGSICGTTAKLCGGVAPPTPSMQALPDGLWSTR